MDSRHGINPANLLHPIPNPMLYMDITGKYYRMSKAFKDFYGVTPKQIVRKTPYEPDPPEQAKIMAEADERIFKGLESHQESGQELLTTTGEKSVVLNSPFSSQYCKP